MPSEWIYACDAEEIDMEDIKAVRLEGGSIAVYRLEDGFYATQIRCTHQRAMLSKGFVFGDVIECPLHQGRFHIPTGKALGAPVSEDLETFDVRVEDGKVYVKINKQQ